MPNLFCDAAIAKIHRYVAAPYWSRQHKGGCVIYYNLTISSTKPISLSIVQNFGSHGISDLTKKSS